MSQRVTLEDIARQSGVSRATVSLVLRDKPGINDETRSRVFGVASSLGYQKRPKGEPEVPSGLLTFGVLMRTRADDPPQTNPFYGLVLAGIETACRRQRINLRYATVPVDEDNQPQEVPRMLVDDSVDGLLLVGVFVDARTARAIAQRTIPTVLVDAYAAEDVYDSVISDNFRAAYEAVSYLIRQGHRHIGMVGSVPNAYPSLAERRQGYLQAVQEQHLSPYFADSPVIVAQAAEATADLLRRSPQVTALFCANDAVAIAAMQAGQASGRRLPDELSIVGFDDIDLAEQVVPALTTMRVDKASMGQLAVQLLLNRAESPPANYVTAVLRPTLVVRHSVVAAGGALPSSATPGPGNGV